MNVEHIASDNEADNASVRVRRGAMTVDSAECSVARAKYEAAEFNLARLLSVCLFTPSLWGFS